MFAELKKRRVFPLLGIYLGAAWVGVEFSNFVVERYHLSQGWVDALIALLALMLPGVLVFAYNHGAPGPDRWTATERVLLPLNLLVALTAAVLVFGDRPTGAMADTLQRADEDGQIVSSTVAREGYRQRILLFGLDTQASAADLKPLALGLPKLIETRLSSNPFVDAESVTGTAWLLARLRRSGNSDGSGVPAALRRRVAEDTRYEWILSGSLQGEGGAWSATFELSSTAPGIQEQRIEVSAPRLTELADSISDQLRQIMARQIGSPDFASAATLDEQYSGNDTAVARYLAALSARSIDNDQRAAAALLDEAIALDQSFARAHLLRAMVALDEGRQADAQADLRSALAHDYRLDDPARFTARSISYGISNQPDKRIAVLKLWTELHPNSGEAQLQLAMSMNFFGSDRQSTVRAFERALQLNPNDTWLHLRLADLKLSLGDRQGALQAAQAFAEAEPKSAEGPQALGRLALIDGDYDEASRQAERAALLRPDLVNPLLDLAEYAALQGDWEDMENQLRSARGVAVEATQHATVACASAQLYMFPGWRERALTQADRCAEVAKAVVSPLVLAMDMKLPFSGLRTEMQGLEATLADIEQTLAGFDGEMRQVGAFARMFAYLHADRADEAEVELAQLQKVLKAWNRSDLDFLLHMARGRVAQLRGQFEQAVVEFDQGLRHYESSGHRNMGAGGFLWVQISMLEQRIRALVESGQSAAAVQRAQSALELYPGVANLHLAYAEAAAADGQEQLAAQALAKAETLWASADPKAVPSQRMARLQTGRQAL